MDDYAGERLRLRRCAAKARQAPRAAITERKSAAREMIKEHRPHTPKGDMAARRRVFLECGGLREKSECVVKKGVAEHLFLTPFTNLPLRRSELRRGKARASSRTPKGDTPVICPASRHDFALNMPSGSLTLSKDLTTKSSISTWIVQDCGTPGEGGNATGTRDDGRCVYVCVWDTKIQEAANPLIDPRGKTLSGR